MYVIFNSLDFKSLIIDGCILSFVTEIAFEPDTLIISLNGSESSVLSSFNIFVGMLLGPIALFGLIQLIRDSMSAGPLEERLRLS